MVTTTTTQVHTTDDGSPCLSLFPLTQEAHRWLVSTLSAGTFQKGCYPKQLRVFFVMRARGFGRQLGLEEAKRLFASAIILLPAWQQVLVRDHLEAEEWEQVLRLPQKPQASLSLRAA